MIQVVAFNRSYTYKVLLPIGIALKLVNDILEYNADKIMNMITNYWKVSTVLILNAKILMSDYW